MVGSNATISKYQRRIVLMPAISINTCNFYATANQGCLGAYCYVWARGDR